MSAFRVPPYLRSVPGLILAGLLLACSRPTSTVAQSPQPEAPTPDSVPHSREANDAGRFLAGLPGTPGSPFAELEKEPAWIVHRREMDKAWSAIETKTLPGMRKFQAQELAGAPIVNSLVFYPFSGPDALMLTVFFPRNPVYVMVALEPPGTLPTPKHLTGKNLPVRLAAVRDTVYSELHRSFFITRQMDHQFRGQVSDGLLLPILQLLVRSGNTILGHRFVQLTDSGHVIARTDSGEPGSRGVEIEFRRDADQSVHKLYYLSVNLSDSKLRENARFRAYMGTLKNVTSYFKATSYMTHRNEFSLIRDEVLRMSTAILQDDSGIPYHYLSEQPWHVQLFGEYVRPYGSFRWLEQADLRKAYGSPERKPLNFQIGYGFHKMPSNLLLASR